MLRFSISIFSFCLFINGLHAQSTESTSARTTTQSLSAVDANLQKESEEVATFARKLAALKTAFAEKDASRTVAYEAYLVNAMRRETEQMSAKATTESAQTERRKSAASGQITPAARPEDAPPRDPFAEATTPTEIRLEKMTYTLAAFERHAFNPAEAEAAARDFAKLDAFLTIMEDELAELKKAGK